MSTTRQAPVKGRITARIIDEETGITTIKKVHAVRIKSSDYVLLVMDDYSPTLGEIDGNVVFLTAEDEISYESISGFYRLINNEFTLVIKEKDLES